MQKKFVGIAMTSVLWASLAGSAFAKPSAPVLRSATALHSATHAASKTATAKTSQMTGTVVSVAGDNLTLTPSRKKNGASKTIMVPATASVMRGKEKIELSSLTAGTKVTVSMKGDAVTSIKASASKLHASTKKMAHPAAHTAKLGAAKKHTS